MTENHKIKIAGDRWHPKYTNGSVFTIIHKHLLMKKLFFKWVLRFLTILQKQRVDDLEQLKRRRQRVDDLENCLEPFKCNKKYLFMVICKNMDIPLNSCFKSAVGWLATVLPRLYVLSTLTIEWKSCESLDKSYYKERTELLLLLLLFEEGYCAEKSWILQKKLCFS